MNRIEKLELLHKVASTLNHDRNGKFVTGETDRLDLIEQELKGTRYYLTKVGLCYLYSPLPLEDMSKEITVISSHVDTHENITIPFSRVTDGGNLKGTYDNAITNAAVLTLMKEDKLGDSVLIAFTGNEEDGMKGASDLANFLAKNRFRPNVIVTDVTEWGYEDAYDFSLENRCNSNRWSAEVAALLMRMGYRFVVEGVYLDDETDAYNEFGYSCLSFCIPTKGSMHSNKGLKARIETYEKYMEALTIVARV